MNITNSIYSPIDLAAPWRLFADSAGQQFIGYSLKSSDYASVPRGGTGICVDVSKAGLPLAIVRIDDLRCLGVSRRSVAYNRAVEYVLEVGPNV